MIQGIIDIGSNTIRMAVYEIKQGKIKLLIKKKHTVGLADYIQDNLMQQEGIDKTCEILDEFNVFLKTFHIEHVVSFATAALRNIENSEAAVRQIIDRTNIKVNVISGDEEADLAFHGATDTLPFSDGILMDIGGASTELVLFKNKKIEKIFSLPVGSLAVHKKYVAGLLPDHQEAVMIKKAVMDCLTRENDLKKGGALAICGIGGTFKGACLLNQYLFHEETQEILPHHLKKMSEQFLSTSKMISLDTLDILVKVVPERIKTITPGMIIADTLADFFESFAIIYSDSGVREGYIYKHLIKSS